MTTPQHPPPEPAQPPAGSAEPAEEQAQEPTPDQPATEDEADFAEEHNDLTVAHGDRGGPEGVPESESPRGYGGMDP